MILAAIGGDNYWNKIWPSEISNNAVGIANAHVPYEWKKPSNEGQRRPDYAIRKSIIVQVDLILLGCFYRRYELLVHPVHFDGGVLFNRIRSIGIVVRQLVNVNIVAVYTATDNTNVVFNCWCHFRRYFCNIKKDS
jgi:hypothetical protein